MNLKNRFFAATSLKDLSPLKSVGLHKLSGDRAGQWAMIVNGNIKWDNPSSLAVDDYIFF